jgi:hypothetical protein
LNNVTLGVYTIKSECIIAEPKFISSSDISLQSTSPCIDKGNYSYVSTVKDYVGHSRIVNGNVDIGAIEYQAKVFLVKKVSAEQRFPWNGLVDVKFEFEEAENNTGNVMLSAKDIIGGTNLIVRTIRKVDGSSVNAAGEKLKPGAYHWIWDAAADLPNGFKCDRVTMNVSVE